MFQRVSRSLAKDTIEEDLFNEQLSTLKFLPNSPCLVNAGRSYGQLAACFVLPVEDSIDGIFRSVWRAAKIHQSGGGTGFDFSNLRSSGSRVRSTGNVASGPNGFIDVFDAATHAIKQGGVRRGANMGILRIDHPDIQDFIRAKRYVCSVCKEGRAGHHGHEFQPLARRWENFNVSVAVSDDFLFALKNRTRYSLSNGQSLDAVAVWNQIAEAAWDTGDPGLFFVDRVNDAYSLRNAYRIAATNPCGEVPLLPDESCNLGSINIYAFYHPTTLINDRELERTVRASVRFLNRVIDNNKFPDAEIEAATLKTRKIGLGIMGFADLLIRAGIPYDSAEGLMLADNIGRKIQEWAHSESERMAYEEGSFPAWHESVFTKPMRNSSVTVIAPTGTIAKIADVSSGIEPLFETEFVANVMGQKLIYKHPLLGQVPNEAFRLAHEISPEWHLKMQAEFQRNVDDSISKTVNMPNSATVDDVLRVYDLAIESGVKGVTLFRDGCLLSGQVLASANTAEGRCPDCGGKLIHREGCEECECGYQACSL